MSAGATGIRACDDRDRDAIEAIINGAAQAYRGVIPADRWHEPYMSREALEREIESGVRFWGWEEGGELVAVMGIQDVRDATLIRHAYVRTSAQRGGIGGKLMDALVPLARPRLLVGTWAAAHWAIRFYEKQGFRLAAPEEKDRLLDTYWKIPDRQRDASVVLVYQR
jgi:GNAT superfamily N-acetyltransferase